MSGAAVDADVLAAWASRYTSACRVHVALNSRVWAARTDAGPLLLKLVSSRGPFVAGLEVAECIAADVRSGPPLRTRGASSPRGPTTGGWPSCAESPAGPSSFRARRTGSGGAPFWESCTAGCSTCTSPNRCRSGRGTGSTSTPTISAATQRSGTPSPDVDAEAHGLHAVRVAELSRGPGGAVGVDVSYGHGPADLGKRLGGRAPDA